MSSKNKKNRNLKRRADAAIRRIEERERNKKLAARGRQPVVEVEHGPRGKVFGASLGGILDACGAADIVNRRNRR